MNDNQSPEFSQPEIKVSKDPAIQERVDLEKAKLLSKHPDNSPEANNEHARDRVAAQLRIERIRNSLKKTEDRALTAEEQAQQETERAIKAEELAYHDQLTGLKNRRWFDDEMDIRLAESKRTQRPLWVLKIDFDLFKKINTQFGDAGGDKALKLITTLQARLEEPIARIGGDEFAQFLDEDIDENGIAVVVDRYIKKIAEESAALLKTMTRQYVQVKEDATEEERAIAEKANAEPTMTEFGLCIGVAKYEEGETSTTLMDRTDKALKRAKYIPGKNKGVIAEDEETFREIQRPIQTINSSNQPSVAAD